jgi:hypothetical protein
VRVGRELDIVKMRAFLQLSFAAMGLCILLAALGACRSTSGGTCDTVLDADTLNRLVLTMDRSMAMQPGEERAFSLGVIECCTYLKPVSACAAWSVKPAEGARMDRESGVLTLDRTTPSGSIFTVSADVEEGRRTVSVDIHVYAPEAAPLVGTWREETQFACDSDAEVIPDQPIDELRFQADGSFSVTWAPIEVYKDYWGTYRYRPDEGTIDLSVSGGNYVPDGLDGRGSFRLDEEGRLILSDVWLGHPEGVTGPARCGHRFNRPE